MNLTFKSVLNFKVPQVQYLMPQFSEQNINRHTVANEAPVFDAINACFFLFFLNHYTPVSQAN